MTDTCSNTPTAAAAQTSGSQQAMANRVPVFKIQEVSSITYLSKNDTIKFTLKTFTIALFLNARNIHFGNHVILFLEVLA